MQVHVAARAISHRSCRLSIAGHGAAAAERVGRIGHGTCMNRLTLALYQPDIPQNTGTILRTCACFGVAAAIIEPAGFPASDRHFRRAGMDYLDHVEIERHVSWTAFEAWRAARAAPPGAAVDPRANAPIRISPMLPATSCSSGGKPRGCRRPSMPPPTPASSFRCGRTCARSMSRWQRRSYLAEALRQIGATEGGRDERTTRHDERRSAARAWFESLQDRIVAAFESLEDECPGPFACRGLAPGRFERQALDAHRPERRARRRRAHGPAQRPRLREGGRARLDGLRPFSRRIRRANSRCRDGSAFLGIRHFADRPPSQSQCAGGAHEHALCHHRQGLVRRRRRSHAGPRPAPRPGRPRFDRLPCRDACRLRAPCGRSRPMPNSSNGATSTSS